MLSLAQTPVWLYHVCPYFDLIDVKILGEVSKDMQVSVKKVAISLTEFTFDGMMALPRELREWVRRVSISDISLIPYLGTRVTHLTIGKNPDTKRHVRVFPSTETKKDPGKAIALPPKLVELELEKFDERLVYPSTLTHLYLDECKSELSPNNLPPFLTHLSLRYTGEKIVLPSTLRELTISFIQPPFQEGSIPSTLQGMTMSFTLHSPESSVNYTFTYGTHRKNRRKPGSAYVERRMGMFSRVRTPGNTVMVNTSDINRLAINELTPKHFTPSSAGPVLMDIKDPFQSMTSEVIDLFI